MPGTEPEIFRLEPGSRLALIKDGKTTEYIVDSIDPIPPSTDIPDLVEIYLSPVIEPRRCEGGCGCRYGTDDPDRLDCACDGPCTEADDEVWNAEA